MNIVDLVGVLGAITIATFYFVSQYKYTFLNSFSFFVGNILGSMLIIYSLLLSSFNLASFCIETLWIIVSFYGIYKYHVKKEDLHEDLTIRQNELSIDNIPTIITPVNLCKDEVGFDLLFRNGEGGEEIYGKNMKMETYFFNGTVLLSPSASSNSKLNVNDINNDWRINRNCIFLKLEDRDYDVEAVKKLFLDNKVKSDMMIKNHYDKPICFFITNFMNKGKQYIDEKTGVMDRKIIDIETAPGFTIEAAKYIASLKLFSAIVIDSITFESEESKKAGFLAAYYLMDRDEANQTFVPLIYNAKTPNYAKDYKDCSIRIGNVPRGIIPAYPVEIKVK